MRIGITSDPVGFLLRHRRFCILAAAVLSALPFTFEYLFVLSWISFAPLYIVLSGEFDLKKSFSTGFLFTFLFHLFIYWWFFALYPLDFAGFDKATAVAVVMAAWIGVSLVQALVKGVFAPIFTLLTRNRGGYIVKAFVFAACYTLAESLTGLSSLAFPWSNMSLPQYKNLPILQLSGLFGAHFVSFAVILCGALCGAVMLRRRFYKKAGKEIRVLSATLAALYVCGTVLWMIPAKEGEKISVAMVQANILVEDKWTGADALNEYSRLTQTVENADLVVWPETAAAINLDKNQLADEYIRKLSEEIQTPIFMGCLRRKDSHSANCAQLIDGFQASEPYYKQALVPFGEFMPLSELITAILPQLSGLNLVTDDYYRGAEGTLIDFDGVRLAPLICFDSIHPQLAASECKDGGETIVLVTNDSWYKDFPAVRQHLAHAAFRAAENGKYVVRAANTGISAVISPKGEILCSLGALQRGVLYGSAAPVEGRTLYSLIGDVFLYLLAVILALDGAVQIVGRIKIYMAERNSKS
ncbi:MAG: apolipoprotein N-acyltransferase [Firmicutes bacterium]|nr:apolipoprotein N-acyltransferase [Bacillota bacterium]